MSIVTTCIGAYPKPDFVQLPDWFNTAAGPDTSDPTMGWAAALTALGPEAGALIDQGVSQVIADQIDADIDVPTDGEVPRENYIHYHCRYIEGIDFSELTRKELRGGTYAANLPTIVAPVRTRGEFLVRDWRRAQVCTDRSVKMTMPGPMTISDTTADAYYQDPMRLGADLTAALNHEVRSLAHAGCRNIQIVEPLFARKPDKAIA